MKSKGIFQQNHMQIPINSMKKLCKILCENSINVIFNPFTDYVGCVMRVWLFSAAFEIQTQTKTMVLCLPVLQQQLR